MTTVLGVLRAALVVKIATIGCSVVPPVQLEFLVVLVAVLEACQTLKMLVMLVVAAVGLDQLLQMLTLAVVIG